MDLHGVIGVRGGITSLKLVGGPSNSIMVEHKKSSPYGGIFGICVIQKEGEAIFKRILGKKIKKG